MIESECVHKIALETYLRRGQEGADMVNIYDRMGIESECVSVKYYFCRIRVSNTYHDLNLS
jgi:hypothetical protein